MTLATTTSADGLIVNKCAHCGTYCVIALDDLHPVLAAGKRPQILCHHCQKLFAPRPDMNVPDEELSRPAAASARRTTFYILLIACAVAGLYWLADVKQLNLSDMIRILE